MATATRAAARLGDRRSISFTGAITRGFFFSLFLGTAFLFLLSFLLMKSRDPARLLLPAAVGASLFLSLLGGYRAGGLHRKSGPLCGLTVGTLLAFVFLLAALILAEGSLSILAIPLYLGMLVTSTLGGWLAARKPKRRRR